MTICWRPKTLLERVTYFSFCLLLASQFLFTRAAWRFTITGLAAVVVVAVATTLLLRKRNRL